MGGLPANSSPEMSFQELPAHEKESLFDDLGHLYDDFKARAATLPAPRGSCAGCGHCCTSPPLYMTCSDLEYAYAMEAVRLQGRTLPVHFEEALPDRRHAFKSWTCPLYSHAVGCTVYSHRPFACRVFGPYSRMHIEWDFCAYKDTAREYSDAHDVPLFDEYVALLKKYPSHRGYVYPDSLAFPRPTVELLLGLELPSSPLQNVRFDLA